MSKLPSLVPGYVLGAICLLLYGAAWAVGAELQRGDAALLVLVVVALGGATYLSRMSKRSFNDS